MYDEGLFVDQSPVVIDFVNKDRWNRREDENAVHVASKRMIRRLAYHLTQTHDNLQFSSKIFSNWPQLPNLSVMHFKLQVPRNCRLFDVTPWKGIKFGSTKTLLKPKFNTFTLLQTLESKFSKLFGSVKYLLIQATHTFVKAEQKVILSFNSACIIEILALSPRW